MKKYNAHVSLEMIRANVSVMATSIGYSFATILFDALMFVPPFSIRWIFAI